jgi:hypothetical protein
MSFASKVVSLTPCAGDFLVSSPIKYLLRLRVLRSFPLHLPTYLPTYLSNRLERLSSLYNTLPSSTLGSTASCHNQHIHISSVPTHHQQSQQSSPQPRKPARGRIYSINAPHLQRMMDGITTPPRPSVHARTMVTGTQALPAMGHETIRWLVAVRGLLVFCYAATLQLPPLTQWTDIQYQPSCQSRNAASESKQESTARQ